MEVIEKPNILFSAERLRAIWVNPEAEKATLTAKSKNLIHDLWREATSHDVKTVEISAIGEAILQVDLKKLGKFMSGELEKNRKNDPDATLDADDEHAAVDALNRSKTPQTPKSAQKKQAEKISAPTPKRGSTATRRHAVDESQREETEFAEEVATETTSQKTPAKRKRDKISVELSSFPRKRKRTEMFPNVSLLPFTDVGDSNQSSGPNFKPFKKQKIQQADDSEIVPVTFQTHAPTSAHANAVADLFVREQQENQLGDQALMQTTKYDKATRRK